MTPRDAWYPAVSGVPDPAVARRRAGRIIFWTLTGLAAAVMAGGLVWAAASLRPYTDPARSMQNTIPAGTRFLVEPGAAVRRGDLVLFPFPGPAAGRAGLVLKRLIGLPGDHVACCDARGRVTVDGRALDETYLYPGDAPSTVRFSVALRSGQAWVLGDHRSISYDSRGYGPVPLAGITGRVVLIAGHGSFTFIPVRTPPAFVAAGLAPPDHRASWPVRPLAAASAGLGALIALAVFGLIRVLLRGRAARRPR